MAARVTISLTDEQLAMIRKLVGSRAASRMARFVEKAVAASIENSLDFRP